MNEEELLKIFKDSMISFNVKNASKLVNIVKELNELTYNDALQLLENAKFVINNSKIILD